MLKVKNSKAIYTLSKKSYKSNHKRNLTAVLAIILTTILFTTLFTVGMGIIKSIEYNTMRMSGGMAHGSFKYLSDEQVQLISKNSLLKKVGLSKLCGYISDERLIKRPIELNFKNNIDLELSFIKLSGGTMPSAGDDIVLDTVTLDMLNIEHKVSQKITLETDFGDRTQNITYNLCGWYESDPAFMSSIGLVSKAFADEYLKDRGQNYNKDNDMEGSTTINFMLKSDSDIEKNALRIINESGYSIDEADQNYINYGINWAYLTTSVDGSIKTSLALIAALLLIMFTGYLIIYNIFQISVIKDIRFYGLLKTIGTTGKQIRRILISQALRMCAVGVPIGLALGFIVGALILPLVTAQMYGKMSYLSYNPIIFIGSAFFAVATVFISCYKPAKSASKITPVEAVKITGLRNSSLKKYKHSANGSKLHKMAFSNLGRNKKSTVTAVLSMSLSFLIMNTVFCLSNSLDLDKYVSQFIDCDFQLAHASYFNDDYINEETPVSDSFVNSLKSKQGFLEGGGIYTDYSKQIQTKYNGTLTNSWGSTITFDENNAIGTAIYAMDDFALYNLNIVSGEYNGSEFLTGNYLLLGCLSDDFNNVNLSSLPFKAGDKVTLTEVTNVYSNADSDNYSLSYNYEYNGKEKEYTIMGIYTLCYTNTARAYGDMVTFAMPINEFINWDTSPKMMTYLANGKKGCNEQLELFLKQYTTQTEPTMNYNSKETYKAEFISMKNMLITIGTTLSTIIGLIGLLNFINSISTSIIARQQEFAMIKSIGMTKKQLQKMLIFEGVYYALLTSGFSLFLGITVSFTIVKAIVKGMWFLSLDLTLLPIFLSCFILIIFAVLIPTIIYNANSNKSIVEQLRMAE
ncbi:MAG TPA: ABC transporter permease [Sedimentibacter sp.]|nr:ABC transporter permease [Sedimentibacter sp.]